MDKKIFIKSEEKGRDGKDWGYVERGNEIVKKG